MGEEGEDSSSTTNDEESLDSIDRLSYLPEDIFHRILFHLFPRESVRTSVLSKSCLRAWKSYPILEFDQSWFMYRRQWKGKKSLRPFVRFVDRSIESFTEQKLRIKRLKICVKEGNSKFFLYMDKWIGLALENFVEDLDLLMSFHEKLPVSYCYTLPQAVFGASFLKSLTLFRCKLDPPLSIRFDSLKKLSLKNVQLNDDIMRHVIASCPYIEDFSLDSYYGLHSLEVSGLECLKTIELLISLEDGIVELNIEAPTLQELHCLGYKYLRLGIRVSSDLRDLQLWGVDITDQFLSLLIANSPRIEKLELGCCDKLENLKFSSHWLLEFDIYSCRKVVETRIDTPNLKYFGYDGGANVCFSITSPLCIADLNLGEGVSFPHWIKLLGGSFILRTLALTVNLSGEQKNILRSFEERLLPPPVLWKIDNLQLDVTSDEPSIYGAVLDTLLSSCRPKTLSAVKGYNTDGISFIEHLYWTLKDRAGIDCSRGLTAKCWAHHLRKVMMTDENGQPYNWNDFIYDFAKIEESNIIYFKLQWASPVSEGQDAVIDKKMSRRFVSYLKEQDCCRSCRCCRHELTKGQMMTDDTGTPLSWDRLFDLLGSPPYSCHIHKKLKRGSKENDVELFLLIKKK